MRSAGRGLTFFVTIASVAVAVLSQPTPSTVVGGPAAEDGPSSTVTPSASRDLEDATAVESSSALTVYDAAPSDVAAKDVSLTDDAERGHNKQKHKKKKPMSKHKKKKQTFKDKFVPLLLIPFVIQMMLMPMFIMNLKFLAMKAMLIGKTALILIAFNMFTKWSQNSHSTSISRTNGLMAQNYGFNGGPEFGALFNGR